MDRCARLLSCAEAARERTSDSRRGVGGPIDECANVGVGFLADRVAAKFVRCPRTVLFP